MRKVYILPNLFTAGSLFCGMLAILKILSGAPNAPAEACALIIYASLLDVFDGAVARLTRTTSAFGLNFDSLSDLVAFGVAPAVLAYDAFGVAYPHLAAAVCSLFAICGALRLARFNVQATREEKKSFSGLPIPGAALAIVSIVWVTASNPRLMSWMIQMLPNLKHGNPLGVILPPALVVIAYLMVSNVPFYGFKSIQWGRRQPFDILVTFIVVVALLYMLKDYLDIVLFVMIWSYISTSLVLGLLKGRPAVKIPVEEPSHLAGPQP